MEKIIYNTKLKKILASLLLFMTVSNFIFPNIVWADLDDVNIDTANRVAKGAVQDIIHSMNTKLGQNKTLGDIVGYPSAEKLTELENVTKNAIREILLNYKNIYITTTSPITDENIEEYVDKIYRYYRYDKDKIEITCNYLYKNAMGSQYYYYDSFSAQINTNNLNVSAISEAYANCREEDKIDTIQYLNTRPSSSAAGQDPGLGMDDVTPVPDPDSETKTDDLGGILLSPVFYLINFIADAVISITGTIMDPGNALDFGLGVLTNTPPNSSYTQTVEKSVDTSSFIPTNLFGGFSEEGSILYQYPHLTYTPEEIFAGKIDLLSIDFITGKNIDGEEITGDWANIRKVVSQWYQVLRMIAIIGLLSVLIYTGIKIIISANAKDKAKYKEWIMNWFMAVAILFSMHIIMAFIVNVTGEFSKLMTEACQGIRVVPTDNSANAFDTNLMGYIRFRIQSENFYIKIGYEVMYIALIWYTLKFTFAYLKRVLSMAFLTLIAPIVALTYPIDKINDGRAQGFDMWIKEYIFNALLQPMHCVLYYILVGSAIEIAATNPIYGIVVLGFMSEAERLLKKIFGFEKAGGGTVGGMTNAFAAGAIASSIAKMAKLPKGNAGKGGAGSGSSGEAEGDVLKGLKAVNNDKAEDDAMFENTLSLDEEKDNLDKERQVLDGFKNEGLDEKDQEAYKQLEKEQLEKEEKLRQRELREQQEKENAIRLTDPEKEKSKFANSKFAKSKFAKGTGNVLKKLAKPYWEVGKGAKYNGERLLRKTGRAALGVGLGIGAAAVQAGISITDGKYNPAEGIASFAAGYAGAGKIASGFRSLEETYKEGTLPDDPNARNAERIKKVQETWAQNDNVIKHNENKYKKNERGAVMDIQKKLLEQGVNDLKEMDDCIKYMKGNNNNTLDGITDSQIREARIMHDFHKDPGVQKVMHDPSKRGKFVDSVAKDERERKILENKLDKVIVYDNIVNKR